jgi:hypothetical protein
MCKSEGATAPENLDFSDEIICRDFGEKKIELFGPKLYIFSPPQYSMLAPPLVA